MEPETSQFARPRVDARALLGLYDPADSTDWGPIRAAQLNAGGSLALFLVAANVIGAALVTIILADRVALWQLVAWSIVVAIVAVAVALRRLSAREHTARTASVRDVRATFTEGLALGAIWSVPAIAFGRHVDAGSGLGLWIVLTILMICSVMAMSALPMATMSFLFVLGAAMTAVLWMLGGAPIAMAGGFFTVILIVACFSRARGLVQLRAAEITVAEHEQTVSLLLREFEDKAADWLWETDPSRRIVRASPRFAWAVGHDPVSINGQPFLQVLAGPSWDSGEFAQGMRELAEKLKLREAFRDTMVHVHVKGEWRWWEIAASPRFDDEGRFCGFRGVGSDVTEQRASSEQINRMARYDTLTGLPNRLTVNEALAKAMGEADKWNGRCAFLMIDLDRFKAVNDTLGHPVGDRLLGRVSERLRQLMTDNEVIGRLGGDEFAVVVRDATDMERVELLAQAIIELLSRPYELDAHTLYIGASVGVAFGPRDGKSAEMLIRSADLALYRSKDAGGGVHHVYEPQLHQEAEQRRVLEMALRKALENNELHLNYQPVVQAGTGQLMGFEALLRWTSPEHGMVPPDKFVPLAEEARLIAPIGEWVLRTACFEAANWPSHVRVAVNVSAEQLHSPNFVETVLRALADSNLSVDRLELEVTESVFMAEGTGATRVLEQLLDHGIRLSLDDFGTGYSSLGYLSRTRFSSIKIDRSFVQGASKGVPEALAIIRAVVALAQSLGMATTAEGVETEDEHLLVQALGCNKVQGYYFGRPLPTEEARAVACRNPDEAAAA